jgi:hypothetical protein
MINYEEERDAAIDRIERIQEAFIKACGYDITESHSRERVGLPVKLDSHPTSLPDNHVLEFIGNGEYQIHVESIDYKVTKNPHKHYAPQCDYIPMPVNSKEWGGIVSFILSHREEIINDINDFGVLGAALDFMERNCDENI